MKVYVVDVRDTGPAAAFDNQADADALVALWDAKHPGVACAFEFEMNVLPEGEWTTEETERLKAWKGTGE